MREERYSINQDRKFLIHLLYLAKQIGHSFEMRGLEREDWHEINVPHMENGLRQKFSLIVFEKFILDTGNEELIEGNWWHDNFWGSCNCEKCKERFPNGGLNTLGNLLMKIGRRNKMKNKVFEIISPPFIYDDYGQMIFDSKYMLVLDVRGWGRFQYAENGEKLQDEWGKFVADALNEKYEREKENGQGA